MPDVSLLSPHQLPRTCIYALALWVCRCGRHSPNLVFSLFPAQLSLHTLTLLLNRSSALSVSSLSRTLCMRTPSVYLYIHLPSLRKPRSEKRRLQLLSPPTISFQRYSPLRSCGLQDTRLIMRSRMKGGAICRPLFSSDPHTHPYTYTQNTLH